MTEDEVNIHDMNLLANSLGAAFSEALHEITVAMGDQTSVPDNVLIAAAINGAVLGTMQFMSDMTDAGRLPDADEKVGLMFQLAADIWTQIRGGPAANVGAVQ